jgi:hypothetical protein
LKHLGILLLIGLVSGCAPMVWDKPGATQADYNTDSYDCEKDARQSGYFGTGIIGGLNMRDFFKRCMAAHGYTLRGSSAPAAGGDTAGGPPSSCGWQSPCVPPAPSVAPAAASAPSPPAPLPTPLTSAVAVTPSPTPVGGWPNIMLPPLSPSAAPTPAPTPPEPAAGPPSQAPAATSNSYEQAVQQYRQSEQEYQRQLELQRAQRR